MNIFIISRGYPTEKEPQWGCFEREQAVALAEAGHTVAVLCVDTRLRFRWRKPGMTIRTDGKVLVLNYFLCPRRITELISKNFSQKLVDWQLCRIYDEAVNRLGIPDILYSHYLFITSNALTLRKRYKIPLVAIEHWSEIDKESPKSIVMRLGKATYNDTDAVIAVSQSLRKALKRHFSIDSTVVHNMVGKEFNYRQTNTEDGKTHFISTGTLVKRKGFDLLIESLTKSGMERGSWHLDIIGEGGEHKRLQRQIDEAGLHDDITLLGQRNKTQIATLLQESDAFVLPSRGENFSVAVLEALACGLPVISSDCGGIRECLDESNGMLFPVEDVSTLSACLCKMQATHHSYDRSKIAETCHARFAPQVIAREISDIFETVANKTIK